jgi:hypothetical protein
MRNKPSRQYNGAHYRQKTASPSRDKLEAHLTGVMIILLHQRFKDLVYIQSGNVFEILSRKIIHKCIDDAGRDYPCGDVLIILDVFVRHRYDMNILYKHAAPYWYCKFVYHILFAIGRLSLSAERFTSYINFCDALPYYFRVPNDELNGCITKNIRCAAFQTYLTNVIIFLVKRNYIRNMKIFCGCDLLFNANMCCGTYPDNNYQLIMNTLLRCGFPLKLSKRCSHINESWFITAEKKNRNIAIQMRRLTLLIARPLINSNRFRTLNVFECVMHTLAPAYDVRISRFAYKGAPNKLEYFGNLWRQIKNIK